jgi:hypothetical protein
MPSIVVDRKQVATLAPVSALQIAKRRTRLLLPVAEQ